MHLLECGIATCLDGKKDNWLSRFVGLCVVFQLKSDLAIYSVILLVSYEIKSLFCVLIVDKILCDYNN